MFPAGGSERVMTPRQLVTVWVEAFNRADADALAEFYTEDAVNHQVAEAPVHGTGIDSRDVCGGIQVDDDGVHRREHFRRRGVGDPGMA